MGRCFHLKHAERSVDEGQKQKRLRLYTLSAGRGVNLTPRHRVRHKGVVDVVELGELGGGQHAAVASIL
jgi:hypothetical protein